MNRTEKALIKAINGFMQFLPVLVAVLLLISLANSLLGPEDFRHFFTGNTFTDPLVGAILGSIAAGNPITSYIIGGELKSVGVSLIAVTAFILSWVTVGVAQSPMEAATLGRRFTIARNLTSFLSAIIIAVMTVTTIRLL